MSTATLVEALRPSVTSHLKYVTADVSDAGKIEQLSDQPTGASHALLFDLVPNCGASNSPILRLPNEVFALCFALLPFRDRISASHVSRRWRSISLSHPAIWAHIDYDFSRRNKIELFGMALNRTGSHPVDLLDCPGLHDGVEGLLVRHLSHIRTLYYRRADHMEALSRPAPRLETFLCGTPATPTIAADFLGGIAGRLSSVHLQNVYLPATCPALSTVTELYVWGPVIAEHVMHFSLLFRLFPVLQSLTLYGLKCRFSGALPVGPPTASLRHLGLSTHDRNYDLTELYASWASKAHIQVEINHFAEISSHVSHLVDAARTIDVLDNAGTATSILRVTGRGPRYRSLEYWKDAADQARLAAHLTALGSALRDVWVLTVPVLALAPFLAVIALLPELARLTLTIGGTQDVRNGIRTYPWAALAPLARLSHRGKLQSVVLHVSSRARPQCAPSAQDAAALLAQLSALEHVRLPEITVTGFPTAALRDVPPAAFSGFRLVFEPAVAQVRNPSS